MKFNTKTIHGGQKHDPAYGSVMPPIYQTSTYAQSTPGGHKGFEYSRTHNPTRQALENAFASIENGKHGLAFGSGLAAIDAVIKLLQPGDEVISTNDLYGGTYRLFTKIFENFGVKFHFIGMENADKVASYINENTKLIWAETPTNPMLNIINIAGLAKLASTKASWTISHVDKDRLFPGKVGMHGYFQWVSQHSGATKRERRSLWSRMRWQSSR